MQLQLVIGTVALHLALLAYDIGVDDEVILPRFHIYRNS